MNLILKDKIIAFIPARGGSEGCKDKNIKLFNGKPLIYYSIEFARKCGLGDSTYVSTDDLKIAELYQMSYANKYFQGLKQRQENLKPRYGLLDGRASERMLDFFGRIVPEGHLRA
ncbi:N-Acetylneuraminate cytidylyltransferase [Indibacter alkaliphilus LW1]|uniref:N-Acetylneuraminate cytidylyltransferase n=1 Tax=Indibacter alkaliphilus (strain CCUG 57479 / KCTC 22604 / LW1) TaxID=1189612 RepID=S2CWI8_INDAL|nr:CMP-N-acetylneuraminic acid synthetase [Indibacter alkaliphilus]EOZ91522.1 N-Acetylneuraminate cytidylyltransferase [Indibacter alkaliphilus LW1]